MTHHDTVTDNFYKRDTCDEWHKSLIMNQQMQTEMDCITSNIYDQWPSYSARSRRCGTRQSLSPATRVLIVSNYSSHRTRRRQTANITRDTCNLWHNLLIT